MDYDAKAREKIEAEMDWPGRITSHTSEPEGGLPDVGLSVGLGNGCFLWCGEISRDQWEAYGEEAAALGSDGSFWLILYERDGSHVLGKLLDDLEAPDKLTNAIAAAIREAVEEDRNKILAALEAERDRLYAKSKTYYRGEMPVLAEAEAARVTALEDAITIARALAGKE